MNMKLRRGNAGFSVIEVMVSMVAGLIVVGAVLAFVDSSLRSNTEYVQSTRLTQELRTTMDFVTQELRRAGYDENSMGYVATSTPAAAVVSPFGRMQIVQDNNGNGTADDACVVYGYDRLPGNPGVADLSNGEIRAVRRVVANVNGQQVGVIEVAESAAGLTPDCDGAGPNYANYPVGCNAATGWCALSDPRVIDITSFAIDTSGFIIQAGTATSSPMLIREMGVILRGALIGTPDVARGMRSDIKVRADCMEASANCNQAPTGV